MKIKSILYRSALTLSRLCWRMLGGRKINAFGQEFRVVPDTTFPNYRKFQLPKDSCRSQTVRYADYVQLHAVCDLLSSLTDHPVIVEVGAHHGAYAMVIGKMLQKKGGKLIAVEPDPGSFDMLRRNVALNNLQDTIVPENCAVGAKAGLFALRQNDLQSRLSSDFSKEDILIHVITMEQLISKHKITEISLLLIDVEGAEFPVLSGIPWDAVAIKHLFCELHPYAWKEFGYNGNSMKEFLAAHGYRCFDMYFKEHTVFSRDEYIGPTVFISDTDLK